MSKEEDNIITVTTTQQDDIIFVTTEPITTNAAKVIDILIRSLVATKIQYFPDIPISSLIQAIEETAEGTIEVKPLITTDGKLIN